MITTDESRNDMNDDDDDDDDDDGSFDYLIKNAIFGLVYLSN
jgi:hypothetical protein